jgi:O-methyltransferase
MGAPTYSREFAAWVNSASDPVRWAAIALALKTLDSEGVYGAIAELGVHRGDLSVVLNYLSPKRVLYLFDTFRGFPNPLGDYRFRDTSAEFVRGRFPSSARVRVLEGEFPDTTSEVASEEFAFVMLDADRYQVTLEGLKFFYTRMARGGYIFIHDYNSPEFDYGAMEACRDFLVDKPERPVELSDLCGSAVLRISAQ